MTESLVPPDSLRMGMGPFADPAVFLSSGHDTLRLARRLIGLQPWHHVLDLGCGCGRVALPLRGFLDETGTYVGLDVEAHCIAWCVDNIQGRDKRFSFRRLDVQSEAYNPGGTLRAESAVLPYEDGSFESALVSSVFTHLAADGIARYLAELGRVLRDGGRALVSAFLMNEATEAAVGARTTSFAFQYPFGEHAWTFDLSSPLEGVAVAEDWFRDVAGEAGLIIEQVEYGNWRDRPGWAVTHDWIALRCSGGEPA